MTSDTAPNIAPETDTVKPERKLLLAANAVAPVVWLVDEAVLELRRRNNRPKFKRAHFIVEAVVEAAREVVGAARADAILKARRKGDVAA